MMQKLDNITLVGMPASGKSTVGVLLAKRLGYSFVDVDIVIQEKEGRLLKEIIAEEGLNGFMEVENRVNAGLSVHKSHSPGRQRDLWEGSHGTFKGDQYGGLFKAQLRGGRSQAGEPGGPGSRVKGWNDASGSL